MSPTWHDAYGWGSAMYCLEECNSRTLTCLTTLHCVCRTYHISLRYVNTVKAVSVALHGVVICPYMAPQQRC